MIVKINSDNIKKLKGKWKRATSLVLSGLLISSLLTGCNRTAFDTKYGFGKTVVFGDDTTTIMYVEQWKDYSGEQLQIHLNDNFGLLTSFVNTTLVSTENSKLAEIIAASFSGTLEEDLGLVKKYN